MRVLIVEGVASSTWGGAEKSMYLYARQLFLKGTKVFLAYEQTGNLVSEVESHIFSDSIKISLSPINIQGPISWIRSIYRLSRFIIKNEIDIVLTHTIHGFPLLRISKFFTGVKICAYFKWVFNGPTIGLQARWGIKCIDAAKAVSKFVVDYWSKQGVKFRNESIIPDGIIPAEEIIEPVAEIQKLLFIGRIYEGKGLHLILEAMYQLQSSYDLSITLTVAGDFKDEEYKEKILLLIAECNLADKVEILGFTNEIDKQIQNHDLIIIPSVAPEAQPLVILESMKNNRLVIATDIGGNPEILTEELGALLFAPTVAALKEKLLFIRGLRQSEIKFYISKLSLRFKKAYLLNNTHDLLNNVLHEIQD